MAPTPALQTCERGVGRGWQWPLFVVVLLLLNAAIAVSAIYYATTDKTFAVEPDYYRKAMRWDSYAAMRDASAKLAWRIHASVESAPSPAAKSRLIIHVTDRENTPVTDVQFRAVAFHHARAADRLELALANAGEGTYECEAAMDRAGLWEIRLIASRGQDIFESVEQVEVPARKPSGK